MNDFILIEATGDKNKLKMPIYRIYYPDGAVQYIDVPPWYELMAGSREEYTSIKAEEKWRTACLASV